jgi:hypothetical protein
MSMMMLAFFSQKKVYAPTTYTKTFTNNESFTVPAGVSLLDSIVGHGAAGTPAVPGDVEFYTHVVNSLYRRTGGIDYVESDIPGWTGPGTGTGNGSNYCDPPTNFTEAQSTVYWREVVCYYYQTRTVGYKPATTGANATGFGKVFPGGVGGPAADVTFSNVPVTAIASYPVTVPLGGSITITYKV